MSVRRRAVMTDDSNRAHQRREQQCACYLDRDQMPAEKLRPQRRDMLFGENCACGAALGRLGGQERIGNRSDHKFELLSVDLLVVMRR
jgi:hypothetical protein